MRDTFLIRVEDDRLIELRHPRDEFLMNWVAGETPWGSWFAPRGIACAVERTIEGARLRERYTFVNQTDFPIFCNEGEVGVFAPFNDDYLGGKCMTQRCHAHIWCGGEISYVCALRMGGRAPHLGLYLTKGSLGAYSVRRDLGERSNDRGDFVLHPAPFALEASERYVLEWVLFWHEGMDDFYRILRAEPGFIDVEASRYVLFVGERAQVRAKGGGSIRIDGPDGGEEADDAIHANAMPGGAEDSKAADGATRANAMPGGAEYSKATGDAINACAMLGDATHANAMPSGANCGEEVGDAIHANAMPDGADCGEATGGATRANGMPGSADCGKSADDATRANAMPSDADCGEEVGDAIHANAMPDGRHCEENIQADSPSNGCAQALREAAPRAPGPLHFDIAAGDRHTRLELWALPPFGELLRDRCRFIAQKQQCRRPGSPLDGAFLTYDNETGRLVYSHETHDWNGGRERVAMGVLLAKYLQTHDDPAVRESLDRYLRYVYRELYDAQTGTVFNDIRRNNDWERLYNYPWMANLFLEMHRLTNDARYLEDAYRLMGRYYERGGARFYAIDIPVEALVLALRQAGRAEQASEALRFFRAHGEHILQTGDRYAAHEVNYEQSIVAPAAGLLLQLYLLTGEEAYLRGAREQIDRLSLFNGRQPDYRLHEVSIRHWDGYWFGKRRQFGDTFPHYWSSLTGNDYFDLYRATGEEIWRERAEDSLRGSLSLFLPGGAASCAALYPLFTNDKPGRFLDPWANDQDWALYFYCRYLERSGR